MENTTQKIQELQTLCALQAQQIAELTAKVNWYEEQYRLSRALFYAYIRCCRCYLLGSGSGIRHPKSQK